MKKILVIDDEEILTRSLALLLEKCGYHVLTAKNGDDAKAMVDVEPFDLMICDIRMPGLNGIETVKAIWKKQEKEKTPVIFVSGYADECLEEEARRLKPLAYFTKPFEIAKVLESVQCGLAS